MEISRVGYHCDYSSKQCLCDDVTAASEQVVNCCTQRLLFLMWCVCVVTTGWIQTWLMLCQTSSADQLVTMLSLPYGSLHWLSFSKWSSLFSRLASRFVTLFCLTVKTWQLTCHVAGRYAMQVTLLFVNNRKLVCFVQYRHYVADDVLFSVIFAHIYLHELQLLQVYLCRLFSVLLDMFIECFAFYILL